MRHETVVTPVLIIGAGAAGLRAAIELRTRGADCLVVGKRAHGDAHTRWAAGGINAALGTRDPDDTWQRHFADTLREGHFVCDPRAVEILARDAPDRVRELRSWGCAFNETAGGEIDQRYFGAQSFRRTCFVGDRTGEAMLSALVERARELNVSWRDGIVVTRVLVSGGRAAGALALDMQSGRPIVFRAGAVLLAAGGCTSVYERSTSRRDENTGDAAALAYGAGAKLRDMEFVQFHPTGMVDPPELRGRLVTEAVRGEGGRLFNAAGERFMERYAPQRLELDARDVVARAIYREIQEGRGTAQRGVLLDVSHRGADFIQERLPKVAARYAELGVDIAREPMQVSPTAHYAMGGIRVDFATGATAVPGLFAVGEATAGVHGANRLGGNSLAETVVFGRRTGAHLARHASDALPGLDATVLASELETLERLRAADGDEDPLQLARELGELLWSNAGIIRTGDGLEHGLRQLDTLKTRARNAGCDGNSGERFTWLLNLRFMLLSAEAILRSGLLRVESRGAHCRAEFPDTDPAWQRSILCARDERGTMQLSTAPVADVPDELRASVAEEVPLDYHHLE